MSLAARSVAFSTVPMRSLLRSHIEAWVKAVQTADRETGKPRGLAPGTIRTASTMSGRRCAARLQVRRQVQRETGAGVEIRPPKSGSDRTVHLADGIVTIIKAHLTRLPGKGAERWLFHARTATRRTRTRCATGGARPARLPVTRRSSCTTSGFYASGLVAAGCDVVTVQRALGHSNATVTLNTYAHLWPTAEDGTGAGAAAMLAKVLGTADEPLTNDDAA